MPHSNRLPHSLPIAIIGTSFRLPGDLGDEAALWEALKSQRNLVTEIPPERWAVDELQHPKRAESGKSITYAAGVLSRIEEFDAGFFGISPREAAYLDPQQRLLLELAWEAMENAGVSPSTMAGSDCAVYVGISSLDYGVRGTDDLSAMTSHTMTGNTLSIAANRLSYVFDFHGPSLAIDTACSSSLVALHHACNCLRAGESSMALVGGVNLLLHPYPFVGFTKASMLSADGLCKSFDASGDGYVRSEGAGVVLLKPYDQAIADGDQIHAVILATGANSDGARKTGITIPSSAGQADLMREVLARSGVSSQDIDFIEAHGTGTAVGDPVEAAAIGQVYGQGRAQPLPIGSVKANLGHLEAGSGMAGLIKAIVALKRRALPPALHLHSPNPQIDFKALNLALLREPTTLEKADGKPLIAGVNSFGFGGANAHVLLQEFRPEASASASTPSSEPPVPAPLVVSARTDAALKAAAQRYADFLRGKTDQAFYDICHAAAFERDRLEKRLLLQAPSADAAADLLTQYAQGAAPAQVIVEDALPSAGLGFVYSGNGAQWAGMGQALWNESPRFAEILRELDVAMRPLTGFSLVAELQASGDDSGLDDTTVAQPMLFAMQVALTRLLQERGLTPAFVMGHSVGEIAAAWACGALDLAQAAQVICARSQAQGATRGTGRMAAVGMAAQAIRAELANAGDCDDVEVAGLNSPTNVTLSGSVESLLRLQKRLEPQGVFFKLLDLDYAFHSRLMDPIEADLASRLAGLSPSHQSEVRFISTVVGDVVDGAALGADYWWKNVREPVRFTQAVQKAAELGCRTFIEVSPHAILQRYVTESLTAIEVKGRVLPTLRRHDDGLQKFEEAAWRAHLLSQPDRLSVFFARPASKVRLPNYPWQRERHWMPPPAERPLAIERRRVHPLLGWRLTDAEAAWGNTLDQTIVPWLADHQVGGAIVFPGSAYAEMALAAAREWSSTSDFAIEQLDILAPMVFDGEHARSLRLVLNPRDGGIQILSRQRLSDDDWTLHVAARVLQTGGSTPTPGIEGVQGTAAVLEGAEHYRLTQRIGLDYGPAFQGLREVRVSSDRLEAELDPGVTSDATGYLLHPAVLDVCFQTLVDFFHADIEAGRGVALLPVKMTRIEVVSSEAVVRLRAALRRSSARSVLADFELLDAQGQLVAKVYGCRFRAAHLMRKTDDKLSSWSITPWLMPHSADPQSSAMPGLPALLDQARQVLGELDGERQVWFKETLPLIEALALSFAFEACVQLQQSRPEDWHLAFDTPYGRWLAGLMRKEALLLDDGAHWQLATDSDLPAAQDLWQAVLRDAPSCLPQLTLVGRVGRQLAALLGGQSDGAVLMDELRQSPIAEVLFSTDPAYRGLRMVLEALLQQVGRGWHGARRLRVLEISAGPSELPKVLAELLPEDRFDYVLALPGDTLRTRQQAEYQDQPNVVVATFDGSDLNVSTERATPDVFDVVILRHTLHRTTSPRAALEHARRKLAPGGVLMLAERHPDWSADLVEGLDPLWWHESNTPGAEPTSSLMLPQTWQQVVQDAGFDQTELLLEPAAQELGAGAYLLLAHPRTEAPAALPAPEVASWLLLADEAGTPAAETLHAQLQSQGQQVALGSSSVAADRPDVDHIVHLCGWGETPTTVAATLSHLLNVVQALAANASKAPRLWIVTRGGALGSGLPVGVPTNPAQSALWGFGRVVMNECPQLHCTLIDLACSSDSAQLLNRLENELLRPDGSNEIVLSPQGRFGLVLHEEGAHATPHARAADDAVDATQRVRLDFHVPGQLRNLVWLADAERALRADEIEVRTQAAGLNFRDVMYLMGLLPDEAVENGFAGASLGLEFSGVVTRVGADVTDLRPGDPVMGFGASCFASHVVTRADAVARVPQNWTFEAAATVPTVFFTVYYALQYLADVQPGERVLIHGAAGGVGIAAIQLARHLGAEIYATAGSDEKRDFVKLLGADHVFDSRSLAFADEIMAATDGQGVDVVLNSLAGEAMRRSLDVVKPFGRFLELGKRDFFENTAIGLRPFKSNISYFGIDADQLLTGRPALATRLFKSVMALFHSGVLAPLPYRTFRADRVLDAFRVMQQARHIGKIVVTLDGQLPRADSPVPAAAQIRFDRSSTWLVTGGLSGFGLASARWLAERGVGTLVLVGRRGLETPGAQAAIDALTAQGVQVLVKACDITDAQAVTELVASCPGLQGVVHAAANFDDRLIAKLDAQSLQSVLRAKLLGAWHLHEATQASGLEHFVLYSSITTAIGNPGQANYVAANAGLEGLARMRREAGLPATCVGWGPIGDAGYLTRHETVKDALSQRLGKPPMAAAHALDQLDRALVDANGHTMPADFDWRVLARLLPSATGTRFTVLNRHRDDPHAGQESFDIRAALVGKTADEVHEIVRDLVVQEVAAILCIGAERIEPHSALHDLGLDSLMAVELALGLEQRFTVQLPVMMLNDAPTVTSVTARIVEKLTGEAEVSEEAQTTALAAGLAKQHGDGMTPEQIEELVSDTRKLAGQGAKVSA